MQWIERILWIDGGDHKVELRVDIEVDGHDPVLMVFTSSNADISSALYWTCHTGSRSNTVRQGPGNA